MLIYVGYTYDVTIVGMTPDLLLEKTCILILRNRKKTNKLNK